MKRYFVDIRGGCGAVRDRNHPKFDPSYQGLHQDTPDVVEYRHGFQDGGSWNMRDEDVEFLFGKCGILNFKNDSKSLASGELMEEFSKDFFEKYKFNAEFNVIFESMLRGESPYKMIEHLLESKQKLENILKN